MEEKFWDRIIFKNISTESKQKIEQMTKRECTYQTNEIIFYEGDKIEEICIVMEGGIKSTDYTLDGKEIVSSYYFEGEAFPFYLLYSGVKQYFFNTYAIKKTKVIWLPFNELKEIIATDPIFLNNILNFVAKYCADTKLMMRATQYRKIEERLAYWLVKINDTPIVKIPKSQNILAGMLHVNRSTLNQTIKQLEQNKIIKLIGKEIHIIDEQYLNDLI